MGGRDKGKGKEKEVEKSEEEEEDDKKEDDVAEACSVPIIALSSVEGSDGEAEESDEVENMDEDTVKPGRWEKTTPNYLENHCKY